MKYLIREIRKSIELDRFGIEGLDEYPELLWTTEREAKAESLYLKKLVEFKTNYIKSLK